MFNTPTGYAVSEEKTQLGSNNRDKGAAINFKYFPGFLTHLHIFQTLSKSERFHN